MIVLSYLTEIKKSEHFRPPLVESLGWEGGYDRWCWVGKRPPADLHSTLLLYYTTTTETLLDLTQFLCLKYALLYCCPKA